MAKILIRREISISERTVKYFLDRGKSGCHEYRQIVR